jgi:hypothetical protein
MSTEAASQSKPKKKGHEIYCSPIDTVEVSAPIFDWDSWEVQTINLRFRDIFRYTVFVGAGEEYSLASYISDYIPLAIARVTDYLGYYLVIVTSCHKYYEPARSCIKIWILKELKE